MLFTIGHSIHELDEFVLLLSQYKIDYVLDVRSTPYSNYAENYNREILDKYLPQHKIHYSYMGTYFGARQENKTLYSQEGYLDFEKVRSTSLFLKGVDNVKKGLSQGHNIALMCTEKDPFDCHRAIMVARGFELEGSDIKHILFDGSLMDQKELDNRLLDKYFPNRNQLTIFDYDKPQDEEELLKQAYIMRNKEIGYHLKLEQED